MRIYRVSTALTTSQAQSAGITNQSIVATASAIKYTQFISTGVLSGSKGEQGIQGLQGIQGTPGSGANLALALPVETPNGVRTSFTTPATYVAGSLVVFLNGLRELYITELTTTTFSFSPAPITSDVVSLLYKTS